MARYGRGDDRGTRLHPGRGADRTHARLSRVDSWNRGGTPVGQAVGVAGEHRGNPHHLVLQDTAALEGDARFKVNPPLRSERDVVAVRESLPGGTIDAAARITRRTRPRPRRPAGHRRPRECSASRRPSRRRGPDGYDRSARLGRDRRGDGTPTCCRRRLDTSEARLAPGDDVTFCLMAERPWSLGVEDPVRRSRNSPFLGHDFQCKVVATVLRGRVTFVDPSLARCCPSQPMPRALA